MTDRLIKATTARPVPFTVDGPIWAASMVILDTRRHHCPVPALALVGSFELLMTLTRNTPSPSLPARGGRTPAHRSEPTCTEMEQTPEQALLNEYRAGAMACSQHLVAGAGAGPCLLALGETACEEAHEIGLAVRSEEGVAHASHPAPVRSASVGRSGSVAGNDGLVASGLGTETPPKRPLAGVDRRTRRPRSNPRNHVGPLRHQMDLGLLFKR